ncbi:SCO family protein [uncultured Paracoccus sp.]|uniref:SCO family protein n=1 Tax=uncultured Paracoccus sp. TaxID=189685 RepID=UPI0025CD0764|nr:SCO family protein [uncultured Paracoccus sp.]
MKADNKVLAISAGIAAIVLIGGGWWLTRGNAANDYAQCQRSVVAGGMDAFGGPFTLTDQRGERVTDRQVFDKPSLLYFGYTYCPDVCPLDAARNAEAVDLLEEDGIEVTPVMVSVDPARDTPEVLADFAEMFHPRMIGLTGTREEIADVAKSWRTIYRVNDQDDPDYYLVDHMTQTYLVMPGTQTVEFFSRDTEPQEMAEQVACFVNASG